MENNKFDKIMNWIREEMAANPPGQSGGFSSTSDEKGPTAGLDHLIGKVMRRKKYASLGIGSRNRWKLNPQQKNGRRN